MILTRTTLSLSVALILSQTAWAQGGGLDQLRNHEAADQADGMIALVGIDDINGDGIGDYLIGEPGYSSPGLVNNGAVLLHSGADGSILRIFAGTGTGTRLGESIASAGDIDGDGIPDVITGTRFGSASPQYRFGEVAVFSGASGNLLYSWAGTTNYERFGESVAGIGDINFDGVPDLLVGAPGANYGQFASGSVYFYSGSTGALIRRTDGQTPNGFFGETVAGGGDVNGDGRADVIIGAPREWAGEQGVVYVITGWSGSTLYMIRGQSSTEWLGKACAFLGDLDNDGGDEFILGSEEASHTSHQGRGVAYVYSGKTGALMFEVGDFEGAIGFGSSVAGIGDQNGDGVDDFLVGADRAQISPTQLVGAVSLLSGRTGERLAYITNPELGKFGTAVAAISDLDGDGSDEILIGDPYAYNPIQLSRNMVYLYSFNPYLATSAYSLSASQGGLIQLDLDFPTQHAGDSFAVLMSDQGPGSFQWGVEIPLSLTPLALASWQGQYPQPLSFGMHGVLDPFGNATAFTGLFASSPARLVGHSFYFAAIAMPAGGLPEATSIAIKVGIIP